MSGRNAPRVETFGCRLNIWESEVVRDQASGAGLNDAIIFNTCAVTAEAERQARQARRSAPSVSIVRGRSVPGPMQGAMTRSATHLVPLPQAPEGEPS